MKTTFTDATKSASKSRAFMIATMNARPVCRSLRDVRTMCKAHQLLAEVVNDYGKLVARFDGQGFVVG